MAAGSPQGCRGISVFLKATALDRLPEPVTPKAGFLELLSDMAMG